ncbi:hypothetical protein F8S13_22130 [Chloroflexia bacterium SDU3-3]|nr:hypothetical protein F8S13_22130 [Chloroflexia bacterium SDU3-3]
MEDDAILETPRGWGIYDPLGPGLIRPLAGSTQALFSSAALAEGLARYAVEAYGSVRVAEQRLPPWVLTALPPADVVRGAGLSEQDAARWYAGVLAVVLDFYERSCQAACAHAQARRSALPAPLIGRRGRWAVALCYGPLGVEVVTAGRLATARAAAHQVGATRLVIYGSHLAVRVPRRTSWRFVAQAEAERAWAAREGEW